MLIRVDHAINPRASSLKPLSHLFRNRIGLRYNSAPLYRLALLNLPRPLF
jgi:hypothetical protein